MLQTEELYRYELEILLASGEPVQRLPLERADFNRAVEAVFFEGLRRGLYPEYAPQMDRALLRPTFAAPGDPRIKGFEVILPGPGGEQSGAFGLAFFKGLVRQAGMRLVASGQVPPEGQMHFQLNAFPDEQKARRVGGLQIELESEPSAIPVRPGSRKELGPTEAWDGAKPDEFPVLFPRHVVEEAVAEARRHPEREVGGVLLGHLRRDGESNELYLEVTCLVPGEETEATDVSVTFTHATWARVREVAEWRGEGELIVGWMHSHPFRLCAECPLPVPAECQAKVLFYSTDDEFLMELSFARPFMVGLLAAVEPRLEGVLGHPPVKLFGWRNGQIEARGFEVMGD